MKIRIRYKAIAFDYESGNIVASPFLPKPVITVADLSNYLDVDLAKLGIVGGTLYCESTADHQLWLGVDYWAPAKLPSEVVNALNEEVVGQLEDGVGEGGLLITHEATELLIEAQTEDPPEIDQVDDGRTVPPPPVLAIAAYEGDVDALTRLLTADASMIDQKLLGCTALQLAILYAHPMAAIKLLENGADPNVLDHMGNTPLEICAMANSLTDADSALIARALLQAGVDANHLMDNGENARSMALLRGKVAMVHAIDDLRTA
jgi:hypothetical protein